VANEPRFPDVPPARIVPALADEGVYLACESSFQRVLRAHGQSSHRGRARAPRASRVSFTPLPTHDTDDSLHAAHLAKRTALAEGIHAMKTRPVLHGDPEHGPAASCAGTTTSTCTAASVT
jgi:putative transposase